MLVHPSAYGEDFSLLFHALRAHENLRGVIVVRPDTLPTLDGLRDKGIRAARFSHRSGAGANFAGSASFDDLLALAPRLADAGLHAELWTDCKALPDIADSAARVAGSRGDRPHGRLRRRARASTIPAFAACCRWWRAGMSGSSSARTATCWPRPTSSSAEPFHEALLQANPERLLWGSDWPHLRVTPAPDAANLLDAFKRWTASDALSAQILVTNPTALYA